MCIMFSLVVCCFKQQTAYELRISDWSSDVCSSDLRPGHLRFDYDPPSPVLIIANGLSLLYYDEELKEATFLPLWETPLWFLIREEVRFGENVDIVAIDRKRVVEGKSVSVGGDLGGRGIIKKKKQRTTEQKHK